MADWQLGLGTDRAEAPEDVPTGVDIWVTAKAVEPCDHLLFRNVGGGGVTSTRTWVGR